MVTIVGGPNVRTDYHGNPGDNFSINLKAILTCRLKTVSQKICLSEKILLLPAHTRHSPQRPADTVGLVIERIRRRRMDAFEWYCEKCDAKVHRREVAVANIVKDLPPVFEEYYGDPS